jgi:hypothetical protein
MGTDEVIAKWRDVFHDSVMGQALKEDNVEAAAGRSDYLARRIMTVDAVLSSEDKDDAVWARRFTLELLAADDEMREIQTSSYQVADEFKKKDGND